MGKVENAIKAKARELGYDGCGIIAANGFAEFEAELGRRSELFPHSAAFYDRLGKRMTMARADAGRGKSIVVCLRSYDKYKLPAGVDELVGKYYLVDGRVSFSREYAQGVALTEYLQGLGFETNHSTQNTPARWSAVRAGLGKFRHNNFVHTARGSFHFIDIWLVDKELEYEPPVENPRYACPEGCSKCIDACPTGALSAPFTMDATRCIAYLSFEPNLLTPEPLRAKMGQWVYGCDVCQNVCPANAKAWQAAEEYYPEPWPLAELVTLERLAAMDEETYRAKLQPRFWYIAKEDQWQWRANAIRAMANAYRPEYREYIARALEDPSENVRIMAAWALERTKFG